MEIVNEKRKLEKFNQLEQGDCFFNEFGNLCIKLQGFLGFNAAELADGECYLFDEVELVEPVNAKVVVCKEAEHGQE